ncbi:unnamed protein product, partial [Hapterophycus canaliculatus]
LASAQSRQWTYKKQYKTAAVLVEQIGNKVTLRLGDGREVELFTKFFSEEDQNYLLADQYKADDLAQWESVQPQISKLKDNPRSAAATSLEYHLLYKRSPYAGIIAGVGKLLDENDFKGASVLFRDVLSRIDRQREVRPDIHRLTRSVVLNNLA